MLQLNDIPELLGEISQNTYLQEVTKDTSNETEFINPPVVVWKFTNHETKTDHVYVAVSILSGTSGINSVTIAEDGMNVTLTYNWPSTIFKPDELFADEIYHTDPKQKIAANHPKIHSMISHLLENGITNNSAPKGAINLTLPCRVQREIGSWKSKAVKKSDGTKIVLLEFRCFQIKKIIEDANTSIKFD